jgi:glycosyltransferase involved in cell wall biosynthesis
MQRICDTLAREGYSVTLVGRLRKHSKPLATFNFKTIRLFCFFESGKMFYIEYNIRLFFWLFFQRFDGVCAVDLDTILPCFGVAKIFNKKIIYDAHEYFTETPEVVRRPRIKRIWERVADATIPRIQHCYTVGNALAKIFSERYHVDFQTVRNVPFENIKNNQNEKIGTETDFKIIFYQGALNEGRGLEAAIAAMQQLENAQLWLAGEGDLSEKLRTLTTDLQLEKRVKFLGWVSPDALRLRTREAYIGLNLLENRGASYYYSLANKFFDYTQAHVPQVTMRFPEYERLCEAHEVAILVETKPDGSLDTGGVAQTLKNLIEDENLYQKLKNNTFQAAQQWNWTHESKQLIAFYQKVFEEKIENRK